MLTILLVEGNDVFRETFKKSIYNHFSTIEIEEAASGEEALEKVNGHRPHLIFMDLSLPGMNGLKATQRIKAAFPEIRIAMLTAHDTPEYRQAATQFGADAFFVKDAFEWKQAEILMRSIASGS